MSTPRRIVVKQDAKPGDIAYFGGKNASIDFPTSCFPEAKVLLAIELVPHVRRGNQTIGWIFEERGEKMFYASNDSPLAMTADLAEWIMNELKGKPNNS